MPSFSICEHPLMFCLVTSGNDEEMLFTRGVLYTHTCTHKNLRSQKNRCTNETHFLTPRTNSLYVVLSLGIRMLNVRSLDKYEGVKTELVTVCFSHKKTLSF